jgi:4-amino-4-deoxy-L-arabinose transferase-like glycosyltransferase
VDKPPAALWITGLSVRLFGLKPWSIDDRLAHLGGLLAGAVMALTPVATLMFRFNNPDALLVLLMTAAAYAVLRSIQDARFRWLLLAGVFLGFGFRTKQLQVLLVVPGLAAAYLLAAPVSPGKRLLQLTGAGTALAVSAGWWLAAVELIPAEDRPYIGGSQINSILELTLGYNGLGRLNGDETGRPGIAGLAGLGGVLLWQRRAAAPARAVRRGWQGAAAHDGDCRCAAALAAPLAYSLTTAATAHSGAIVSAGPAATGARGNFAGLGNFGRQGTLAGPGPLANPGTANSTRAPGGFGGRGGGMGGLLGTSTPSDALVTALRTDAASYTWAAAVVGSNNAAGYQLAAELPVMAVGGFNGTDPAPTLEVFQQLVADGKIHYFIGVSMMQGETGSDAAARISEWVAANFQAEAVGGATVYDLS